MLEAGSLLVNIRNRPAKCRCWGSELSELSALARLAEV